MCLIKVLLYSQIHLISLEELAIINQSMSFHKDSQCYHRSRFQLLYRINAWFHILNKNDLRYGQVQLVLGRNSFYQTELIYSYAIYLKLQ